VRTVIEFHAPLAIYARFEPPEIAMEATIRVPKASCG
jgi:hypothetical protein